MARYVSDEALASRLDEWAGLRLRDCGGGKLADVTASQLSGSSHGPMH